jgi:hypothetical protein
VFAAITSVSVVIVYLAYLMVTVPALLHRLRGTSLSYGRPVLDLGRWGIPVNLIAVVMGAVLCVNIAWPRQEVYDPDGSSLTPWSARRSNLTPMWARVTLNPDIAWRGPTVVGR